MQGSARRSRDPGHPARVLYRCEFGSKRAVPPAFEQNTRVRCTSERTPSSHGSTQGSPRSVTPEALAASQSEPSEVDARAAGIAAELSSCQRRIERLLESIENGVDYALVVPRLQQLQAEQQRLEASVPRATRSRPLGPHELAQWSRDLGGLVTVLRHAEPAERAAVYEQLGLTLYYYPASAGEVNPAHVRATADLARVGRRVGGPIPTRRPPSSYCGRNWRWRVDSAGKSGA